MSRIGRKPITIPENVQVELGPKVIVRGPLGELSYKILPGIKVEKKDSGLLVSRTDDSKEVRALHGLTRSLIANNVEGVSLGFKKNLELRGIGFRASISVDKLLLSVGYSHPVEIEPPAGISFAVSGNKILVKGIDKELVGRVASEIRATRPPDAYKGKGIRYEGETVRLKPGKAAKAGVGAAT